MSSFFATALTRRSSARRLAGSRRLSICLLALALAGPAAVGAAEFRGFASPGPLGLILFQACRGKTPARDLLKVDDATPESSLTTGLDAIRRIMLESGRPIYVEFQATPAAGGLRAIRFVRAVGTYESCAVALDSMPAATRVWAEGQEPNWQLFVSAQEARFERPGEKPVRFPASAFLAPVKTGTTRVIDAWSALDGGTVRAELTEAMCSDGRSETAYGTRIILRYGSRTYEGCAASY